MSGSTATERLLSDAAAPAMQNRSPEEQRWAHAQRPATSSPLPAAVAPPTAEATPPTAAVDAPMAAVAPRLPGLAWLSRWRDLSTGKMLNCISAPPWECSRSLEEDRWACMQARTSGTWLPGRCAQPPPYPPPRRRLSTAAPSCYAPTHACVYLCAALFHPLQGSSTAEDPKNPPTNGGSKPMYQCMKANDNQQGWLPCETCPPAGYQRSSQVAIFRFRYFQSFDLTYTCPVYPAVGQITNFNLVRHVRGSAAGGP